jgi:hypothetical protein
MSKKARVQGQSLNSNLVLSHDVGATHGSLRLGGGGGLGL